MVTPRVEKQASTIPRRPGEEERKGEGRVRPRRGRLPSYLRLRAGPASLGRAPPPPPPPAALGLPPHATCAIGPAPSLPWPAVLRRSVVHPSATASRASRRGSAQATSDCQGRRLGHYACALRQISAFCGAEPLRLRSYPSSPRGAHSREE
ncbi:hypothetical protein P7K49_009723 [Saguinus oedipus]|uniref:Uncharacterized protein n=1 Tax=Saguinus oedipus TaxID=9490 RepID=A0ABQ9VL70_SAGOE|nr:hypothetical protein P7K49_009723 [Saguinus oedipus]